MNIEFQKSKDWLYWFIYVSAMIVLISQINLWSNRGYPFGSYLTHLNVQAGRMTLEDMTPPWWFDAPLNKSDKLIEINGEKYNNPQREKEIFQQAYENGGNVSVTIKRDGVLHQFVIPVTQFGIAHILQLSFPGVITSVGVLLIIFNVYNGNPQDTKSRVLTMFLCTFLVYVGASLSRYSLFWHDGLLGKGIDLIILLYAPMTGATLIHLTTLFPKPVSPKSKFLVYVTYAFAVFISVTYIISRLMLWSGQFNSQVRQLDHIGYYYTWALVLGAILLFVLHCIYIVLSQSHKREKREALVLILSLFIGSPILIVSIGAPLGADFSVFASFIDLRYLYLVIPFMLAAITLRYQSFRSTPESFLLIPTMAICGIVSEIVATIVRIYQSNEITELTIPLNVLIFLSSFACSFIWINKNPLESWLTNFLQWEKHSFDAVQNFGQTLLDTDENIYKQIPALIQSEFGIEFAGLWLWDEESDSFILTDSKVEDIPKTLYLSEIDLSHTSPVYLKAPNTPFSWVEQLKHIETLEVIIPLVMAQKPVGILGLGKRWDNSIFDQRDLKIIRLLAQQATLFLLTSQQVAKLKLIPQQISEAQEKARFKVAQELHDTTQQFLGRLPFLLEVSRLSIHDDDLANADALLLRCLDDIEDAAKTVRRIRHDLAPIEIQQQFDKSITDLIERKNKQHNALIICLEKTDNLDDLVTQSQRHDIYRIIQQALDNAIEHAQATHIWVVFRVQESKLNIKIKDNGKGFHILSARKRGFGLTSMEAHSESIGSPFHINSTIDEGTTLFFDVAIRSKVK